MNWAALKNKIYFEDGSLRDIYVYQTTIEDWRKWVALVNERYTVEFYDAKTDVTKYQIDFNTIEQFWSEDREVITATIKLGVVQIKCYFFTDSEIENDIDPREVKSLHDHNNLVNYLRDISDCLGKDIFVTGENSKDWVLLNMKDGQLVF